MKSITMLVTINVMMHGVKQSKKPQSNAVSKAIYNYITITFYDSNSGSNRNIVISFS